MSSPTASAANKRVPLAIPFAGIGFFSAAQLWLGTSPEIIAMCTLAVAAPLLPLWLYGRDLYSLLGILFSLRYGGIALVAKTFYGQTLESNLFDPYAAYGLTLLLMAVVTGVLISARKLDRGKSLFSMPTDLRSLRRLSLICVCIGMAAEIVVAANKSLDREAFNGGAVFIIGANLQDLLFLGLIAEVAYAIAKSEGRSFVTPRLVLLLLLETIIVIVLNVRELLVSGLIGIVTVAFLHNMLRIRHLLIGLAAGAFFISIFTPVTLFLRMAKEGMSISQFVELAENTVVKAATDPDFFRMLSNTVESASFEAETTTQSFDYYGDRSSVLNRLSYVGLVDAVYNGTRTREPLGTPALDQAIARAAPGFLGYDKQLSVYGMGDWLSWHTGISEPGFISFLSFALPMEGLAAWGLIGFIAYPIIFMLPVLYICGSLSSFRLPLPVSIFLFTEIQHMMVEQTSDDFLGWLTRTLPLTFFSLFILYKVLHSRALPAHSRAAGAVN